MAGINPIEPVAAQIKPVQGMSLADMVGMARNIQAYQQAEQVNPLALQKAQEEVNQTKLKTETDQMALAQKRMKHIADSQISMINNPLVIAAEQNPSAVDPAALAAQVKRNGLATAKALGIGEDKAMELLQPYLEIAQQNPAALRQYYKERHIQGLDEGARTTALTPSGVAVNYGTGGQVTATNPFGAVKEGVAIPGTQYQQGLAPQTFTTETGAPGIIGGTGGGIVNQAPQGKNVAPAIQKPVAQGGGVPKVAPAGTGMQESFNAKGGLQRAPDETYDAYKARVSRLSALPTAANNALNLGNVESIPNMELTNNRVLKLLENNKVNIGPVANAIAKKTGGIGLSNEEQEVVKYLEQRIRQEGARSNQDQASQSKAYGSFGTSKEALRDILYNDKAILASQRMLYKGIKNHQGNPNQPNLGAINAFENEFNNIAQNPDVMHLIGVVGNKSMEDLSITDRQHLKKYFKGKSQDYIDSIFAEKDKLEKLVGGK